MKRFKIFLNSGADFELNARNWILTTYQFEKFYIFYDDELAFLPNGSLDPAYYNYHFDAIFQADSVAGIILLTQRETPRIFPGEFPEED